jgi:hypothetical protein
MFQREIDNAIRLKRNGDFQGANQIYSTINEQCPNDPDIIMSWAKIFVCLGEYDTAIEKYKIASRLFRESGRDRWKLCDAQIMGINNRFNEPEKFKDFIVSVSGNSISRENINLGSKEKSGCFVATTVYGDYNACEVIKLRRFRDNTLSNSLLGRSFIRSYYFVGPFIANFVELFHLKVPIKYFFSKLINRMG